jgi:hypothetical protein
MAKPTDEEIAAAVRAAFDPPNITNQMKLAKLVGLERAAVLGQECGGKLGTLEQRRPEKIAGEANPWADNFKNGDPEIAKANILRSLGTKAAAGFAKAAVSPGAPYGKTILGYPLKG